MSEPRPSPTGTTPSNYAGDISPTEGWQLLTREPQGQLVDVRTEAEWNFVGVPDLNNLGRSTLLCEWQFFPPAPNPNFVHEVEEALKDKNYKNGAPVDRKNVVTGK